MQRKYISVVSKYLKRSIDTALNIRTCITKAMRISRLPSSAQIMIDQKHLENVTAMEESMELS